MIKIIHPASTEEWDAYYNLRYKVLREPWNQPRGSEKDEMENSSYHFFALVDNIPAGVGRLQFNSTDEGQIRFMGVDEAFRGQQIGRKLINQIEAFAKSKNCKTIVLQARENAVNFYQSCGYQITEKSFLMWNTIQHYKMNKDLL